MRERERERAGEASVEVHGPRVLSCSRESSQSKWDRLPVNICMSLTVWLFVWSEFDCLLNVLKWFQLTEIGKSIF